MGHIAKLNSQNKVVSVAVVLDETDEIQISKDTGETWKRTSYNTFANEHALSGTPFRKNYAGIGFKYYVSHDGFAPPKPYASWTLNGTTCQWEAPTPKPDNESIYMWNEDGQYWDLIS